MGWPKKNETFRLYYERKNKTYLMVSINERHEGTSYLSCARVSCYEAVGELMQEPDPKAPWPCTTSVSPMHLYMKCRRVSWNELPKIWKDSFNSYLELPPQMVRGFWRIGEEGVWDLKDLPLHICDAMPKDQKQYLLETINDAGA